MKNVGSFFEYEEERNADLMRVYNDQISREENCSLTDAEIYERIVEMPSQRFWVSEERAAIVVSAILRGDNLETMRPNKREMYYDIFTRVMEAMQDNPSASIYNLTFGVVNSPAPRFYLTPGSAKVIICKIKRKWYEKRRSKR